MTNKKNLEKYSSHKIPPPSFVKLAMKNMVRKGSQSLTHLGLTAFGVLGFIITIAYLARPNIPN